MSCVLTVFRAELRRRWASWLAISLLVTLVAGTVLAGVSAGRRTATAFPNFVSHYGYDAQIFSSSPLLKSVLNLPIVTSVASQVYYPSGPASTNGRVLPASSFSLSSLPVSSGADTYRLVEGRLPTSISEAVVGFSMEQQLGVHMGSIVTLPLFSLAQTTQAFARKVTASPHGPVTHLRVVGIEASVSDFPSNAGSFALYTSPAFDRAVGTNAAVGTVYQVRLRHGRYDVPRFQAEVIGLSKHASVYVGDVNSALAGVQGSIHPQAIGWWLLALLEALAGLALIGQALSRQSLIERESYPTLSALGFRPSQIFAIGLLRSGTIGAAGAVGAVALAFALSPLTPVGEARAALPSHGLYFDIFVFGLGAAATSVLVLAFGTLPAWKAARIQASVDREDRIAGRGASSAVELVARTGAPPSVLVGARHALERGRGRSSVPVASALTGTVVAVAALVATAIFGASTSYLLATPRLYGVNWQVSLSNFTGTQASVVAARLAHDPKVSKVSYGMANRVVTVHEVPVVAIVVNVAKGPMAFSLIDGHYPTGDDQIALGPKTLSDTGTQVGSKTSVSFTAGDGKVSTREFTVVGSVALPSWLTSGGLGNGAVLTVHAARTTLCTRAPGVVEPGCVKSLGVLEAKQSTWGLLIGTAPGTAGTATATRIEHTYKSYVDVSSWPPTDLVNFGQAINFPALLGVTLGLFGAAMLAHLLFASISRRRREVALLKVLGFTRRQVSAAVRWQATTIAFIGIAVGVPIGIAVGHAVWRAFASGLGAVPEVVVPVGLLTAIVAGVILVSNVLAIAPAALAARLRPAEVLRES
jgi:hypothetical protein